MIYGVVKYKEKGVVILSKFKIGQEANDYGKFIEDENGRMFALTNYQGEVIADGPIGSYFGKKVGTYDWGSSPLALYDCGTPYTPPPPTPEEIAAAKAAQEKAKVDAKAKAAEQRKIADARALRVNQDAAAKGDSFGLMRMGERYRDGDGVEKDLSKARVGLTRFDGHLGGGGRRDLCRLDGQRQWPMGSGETKSARTDFNAAGGNLDLPRPRSADDGGGGEGTQSVFLICSDWQAWITLGV